MTLAKVVEETARMWLHVMDLYVTPFSLKYKTKMLISKNNYYHLLIWITLINTTYTQQNKIRDPKGERFK